MDDPCALRSSIFRVCISHRVSDLGIRHRPRNRLTVIGQNSRVPGCQGSARMSTPMPVSFREPPLSLRFLPSLPFFVLRLLRSSHLFLVVLFFFSPPFLFLSPSATFNCFVRLVFVPRSNCVVDPPSFVVDVFGRWLQIRDACTYR